MKSYFLTLIVVVFLIQVLFAQDQYLDVKTSDSLRVYINDQFYEVQEFDDSELVGTPKNVILFIGDGMGVSHVYAALTANNSQLYLKNFKSIGFQTTYSDKDFITDSAAAGTALAAGKKTFTGALGVDVDTLVIENIREKSEKLGMATGVVATSTITHATPAAFVAHQPRRSMYEAIAADFLKTNIDVFIGGGYNHFAKREDGRDLIQELKNKGYQVLTDIDEVAKINSGKLAGLVAAESTPKVLDGRGNMLEVATETAIRLLSQNDKGFFLMVEGSQIDWGGHENSTPYIVTETLDMDKAIGKALVFAANNKETLIIVTADHETGGMAITGGNPEKGMVEGMYVWGNHSAVMVPVFAFGPGAEHFSGFYDNTDIPKKIYKLLKK
ncbi:MAG TPA: alkaline phosphatase [Prolixibacteraceae bacterium]|nr:alkaline phosphatase [Prolixibacteraceae bacterium]